MTCIEHAIKCRIEVLNNMRKYKSEAQWKSRSRGTIHMVISTLTQLKCMSCGFIFNSGEKCEECRSTNIITPKDIESKCLVVNLENTMIDHNRFVIEYIAFP